MTPAELLRRHRGNPLVQPAVSDRIGLLEVAAPGSCSVVAVVSQDKVVSVVRNTEIVADATNSITLHVAALRKQGGWVNCSFVRLTGMYGRSDLRGRDISPIFRSGAW